MQAFIILLTHQKNYHMTCLVFCGPNLCIQYTLSSRAWPSAREQRYLTYKLNLNANEKIELLLYMPCCVMETFLLVCCNTSGIIFIQIHVGRDLEPASKLVLKIPYCRARLAQLLHKPSAHKKVS